MKTKIGILIVIIILVITNYYYSFNLNKISPEKLSGFSQYTLAQDSVKYLTYNLAINQPYPNTPPDDRKYWLVDLKDNFDLYFGNYTDLDMAEKRVVEMEKWGNNLSISMAKLSSSEKRLDTWENFVAQRYRTYIDRYIQDQVEKPLGSACDYSEYTKAYENAIKVKKLLLSHQRRLELVTYNLHVDAKKLAYIQELVGSGFRELNTRIDKYISDYSPEFFTYDLKPLKYSHDYGTYNIYSDNELLQKQFPKIDLKNVDVTSATDLLSDNIKSVEPLDLSVARTMVDENIDFLKYENISLNLIDNEFRKSVTKTGQFEYLINLTDLKPLTKYYLRYSYQIQNTHPKLDHPLLNFSVINQYLEYSKKLKKEALVTNKFVDGPIIPNNIKKTYEQILDIPDMKMLDIKYQLTITSPFELDTKNLSNIKVEMYEFIDPEITISKVGYINKPTIEYVKKDSNEYQIAYTNLSKSQIDEVISKLGWGWEVVPQKSESQKVRKLESNKTETITVKFTLLNKIIFILSLIFTYLMLGKYIFLSLKFIWKYFWKIVSVICLKSKIFLLSISLFLIIIDIFLIPKTYDIITFSLIILWIGAVVGYRLEGRFSFASALAFLVICPISLILKNEFIAEKAAIWTYMFLVVGTVQSLIELKVGNSSRVDLDEYWAKIKPILIPIVLLLQNKLTIAFGYIYNKLLVFNNYLHHIFTKKRSPKDVAIFGIKVIVVAIILVVTIITSIFIVKKAYEKYQVEYKKYQRNAMNPAIRKSEPYYVYKGTKVLLRGDLFGLTNEEEQRLMSDAGELPYSFWDDSKIVFEVPIDWKPGEHSIWIEKKINWETKWMITKSNEVKIKLLPITGKITPEDDKYFEQLKKLDKETLKLNGYN